MGHPSAPLRRACPPESGFETGESPGVIDSTEYSDVPAVHTFLGMPAVIASGVMRRLLEFVERAARTRASVLITGETGTGKELIARAIHQCSMRAARPWIDLNCAALPELLLESELFGYEKGAFSGALASKPGMFELAHTGSVFLDEISELSPRMQVKLLRVLDGAPYYRLGGTRKVSVDVRVIAASNQNLEEATAAGGFRRDLYHRLAQLQIQVPPLRERQEDIAPLARFFLEQQGQDNSRPLRFSAEAIRALERYAWPGNVRELRNVVVQAAVMAEQGPIEARHLPVPVRTAAPKAVTLEAIERETILRVLAENTGQQQRAADILGISLRTLARKLKAYNAERRVKE